MALPSAEPDLEPAVRDPVAVGVVVRALGERRRLVEEVAGEGDHAPAAHRVVVRAALGAAVLGDRIGAVERIVEAAPAGVGGVQRIARIGHRHDQLRPGDRRDLGVQVGGAGGEVLAFRQQVADLAEKAPVGGQIEGLAAALQMPGVDLGLQLIARRQERAVAGRQIVDDRGQRRPEPLRVHARPRQRLVVDEVAERLGDPETVGFDPLRHGVVLRSCRRWADCAGRGVHNPNGFGTQIDPAARRCKSAATMRPT